MRYSWNNNNFINSFKYRLKNILSSFFYYFAKSKLAAQIQSRRQTLASIYDCFAVITAWISVCWIFSDFIINTNYSLPILKYWQNAFRDLMWILPIQIIIFRMVGLYRGFWRFASIKDVYKIFYASFIGSLFISFIVPPFPQAISLLYGIFLITLLSAGRLFVRFAKDYKLLYKDYKRVIIVGAGNAGESLVRDLLRDHTHFYKPIVFIDDDLLKQGREIHGIRVVGTTTKLPELIKWYQIDLIMIAIPSASSASMRSIVEICEKTNIPCFTLPGIKDLANGRVSINVLRPISLVDLLGRYPVTCQWESIKSDLKDKTILITGGGGSIGSELCRQIASLGNITKLIIVDNNEFNLYSIDLELKQNFPEYAFEPVLLSITDHTGINSLFKKFNPQIVFHAAAYKHVPLLESQHRTAIFNNIIGTCILAEESNHAGVEKFILISSDKAVNPTNIMGATKRSGEYYCQNLNSHSKTQFITVRFGNVLDSAGSVVPLFRKQIEAGGPVTVTHPEITRFFMTIPEAAQLILQATFLGEGGEIFVLDMGDPIKIRYLAEQMIKLADKVVGRDIEIVYTGLRPGEKLYEECFYANEFLQPTAHAKILKAQSSFRDFNGINEICHNLENLCRMQNANANDFIELLIKLVPEYHSSLLNQQVPLHL